MNDCSVKVFYKTGMQFLHPKIILQKRITDFGSILYENIHKPDTRHKIMHKSNRHSVGASSTTNDIMYSLISLYNQDCKENHQFYHN